MVIPILILNEWDWKVIDFNAIKWCNVPKAIFINWCTKCEVLFKQRSIYSNVFKAYLKLFYALLLWLLLIDSFCIYTWDYTLILCSHIDASGDDYYDPCDEPLSLSLYLLGMITLSPAIDDSIRILLLRPPSPDSYVELILTSFMLLGLMAGSIFTVEVFETWFVKDRLLWPSEIVSGMCEMLLLSI
jgi:hypothetical protein